MAKYALDTGGSGNPTATSKRWTFGDLFTADYWKNVFENIANHPSTYGALGAAQSGGQSGVNILGNIEQAQVAGGANTSAGLTLGNQADVIQQENPVDLDGISNNFETTIENNPAANDASVYGRLQGSNVEEQLEWLINNDPENAQGWLEQLIGLRGNRENNQIARDNEEYIAKNKAQWVRQGLEAAGINPILASNYLTGSSGLGTPGMPDSNILTNAVSRANNKATNKTSDYRSVASLVVALIALVGVVAKTAL